MSMSPRWRKLIADLGSVKGRLALVVVAMAVGLMTTIVITSAHSILTREISANYLGTNPASGILDVGSVDSSLVDRVRGMDNIAAAEPLSIIESRVSYPNGRSGRALLFVSPDPLTQSLNTLRLEDEVSPRPAPAIYLERRALDVAGIALSDSLSIEIPGAGFVPIPVAATVFDPSLAPAGQEQTVYAYIDQRSFVALGGEADFEMIKVRIADAPFDQTRVDDTLANVAKALKDTGIEVHLVQSPDAGMHPHEGQMQSILGLFLMFGILAFLLSSVLVSVTIEGLMTQQIRQIAIMKTIGARTGQIAVLYLTGISVIGAATLAVALPLGLVLGRSLAGTVADLLNFDIADATIPPALFAAWIAAGLAVPVLVALRPIFRTTGTTVTEALSDLGIGRARTSGGIVSRVTARLFGTSGQVLLTLRGAFRRRGRTLMILSLLALAGAMFLTARTVSLSYQTSVEIAADERWFDAEIRLTDSLARETLDAIATTSPGLSAVQTMRRMEAANTREDGVAIVRTYPDGGHGAMTLYGIEGTQGLAHYKVLDGTLPPDEFDGGLVVNQGARALLGNPEIGESVSLSLDGRTLVLPLAAVLRQYMAPATVFASMADIAAATGSAGVNTLQVTTVSPDVAAVVAQLERQIEAAGSGISLVVTENLIERAVSGHIDVLIFLLLALGVLMAAVGFLGLTAAQGISVVERTREFGIIRAIGGRRRQILTNLLAEGLVIAVISLPAAVLISLPLSYGVGVIVGRISFGMPLPFAFDFAGIGQWTAIALVGALTASLPPALNASRLSVREALIQQ